ncbi:MAG: PQQ-binding-like beta-propeller repeat protein [Thermoplasmata archaeon]
MGWKTISASIVIILIIGISLEVGVFSSIELQDNDNLENENNTNLADSAWPKYRGNNRNTGRSPYDTSHIDGGIEWDLPGYGSTRVEPVIGPNGTIYVGYVDISSSSLTGSRPATLSAINPNGTEMWKFQRGDYIHSTPAVDNQGTIYLGINEWVPKKEGSDSYYSIGTFYAVNPNGTEKWNYSVDSSIYDSPSIGEDGTIYISSGEKLYAFDQDGTVKWNLTFKENLYSSPAIGTDGTIYVGARDTEDDWEGYLYAINPDGTKEWSYHTENGGLNSPTIADDGKIYVTSTQGNLYALESDGTESWKYYTEGTSYSSSIALGQDGTVHFSSGHLYAVNPDGSEKWIFNISDDTFSRNQPIVGGDGTIYVGSLGRTVYAIDPEGKKSWDLDLSTRYGDGYLTTAIDDNGTLYIAGYGLHALGEKEQPELNEVLTAFLADNWCFILMFSIFAIPVIYKIIKSRNSSSSVSREDIFKEDDSKEYKK